MRETLTIQKGNTSAEINLNRGQLVSLVSRGVEYFHNGGAEGYSGPGWKSSNLFAFPVFGPVPGGNVRVGDQVFPMDQHGILRHLADSLRIEEQTENSVLLAQGYFGNKVPNSKHKEGDGRPEFVSWLPHTIAETYNIRDGGLDVSIRVRNLSPVVMPYDIGMHPAFTLLGDWMEGAFYDDSGARRAKLRDVMKSEHASRFPGVNAIEYRNGKRGVRVSSQDLDNMVLWSPGPEAGMFCIEPISQMPNPAEGYYFSDSGNFERLKTGEQKEYSVAIDLI